MTFHLITLFPNSFDSYLGESILKRAIEDRKIKVKFYNPRDYSDGRVDDKPYSGGPGMVIEALPVIKAIEKAINKLPPKSYKLIWLSPSGKQFDNSYAKKITKKYEHIIIICGRYEGIDARVKKVFKMEEVSVGPFVLTGGELPAMIMVDVMSRQVEGVLGNFNSLEESRTASKDVYTRPEVFVYKDKKYKVPKILLSGNRAKIEEWKKSLHF
ncbi:MAG: tRNA (guanosine(37)-N1)-methyltransferase TrmD [Patescibacteria group bacterium]|nr:tRNA (guanosine(37)-N1)-methyltransferase TrmD [Patescibacteria group bacterium]